MSVLAIMPEIVRQISAFLRDASPMVLIVVGAVLFLFAGAVKWLVRLIGAGLFIYGILIALGLL